MRTKEYTAKKKKQFLEQLQNSHGIVAIACDSINISRRCYYAWKETDPDFKKRVDEIEERTIDFAESKLLSNINSGDTTAIIFYLKCKAKDRGYSEKSIVEVMNHPMLEIINRSAVVPEIESED